MQCLSTMLANLRRPKLLVSAARIGVSDYRRKVHLTGILHCSRMPGSGEAVMKLLDIEADMNMARLNGEATYSPLRHVSILIALLGEARLLRASQIGKFEGN